MVITEMEHHSNIVPWQLLTERKGAELRWFGLTDDGHLDLSNIDELITERTKVVSLTWVSNMLGTINPVAEIARRAHEVGAVVVVDASQAAPQLPVDVQAVDADFLAFTGHKVVGPTGIGVLWGRRELLDQLPPFLGGGEMIETVTMERSTYAKPPHKFEAGTPPIVEAVGLGAALEYLTHLGLDTIHAHEQAVTGYLLDGLASVGGVTVLGPQDPAHAGERWRSSSTASIRTTSRSCSTAGAWPCGRVITARSRRTRGTACRAPRAPRRTSTRRRRKSMRSSRRCTTPRATSRWVERRHGRRRLYQEIILDHYKNPQHAGLREPYEAEVHHVNPTCGDEVTLRVHLDGETVEDVSYAAEGCSISQAAASVMAELLIGKDVAEAMSVHDTFLELMQGRGQVEPDEDVLEDGVAFAGVAKFPARIKCALLPWMAWKDATAPRWSSTRRRGERRDRDR